MIMDSNGERSQPSRLKRWCKAIWKFCVLSCFRRRKTPDDVTAATEKNLTFAAGCSSKAKNRKETAVGGIESVPQVEEERNNETNPAKIVYTVPYLLQFERKAVCQMVPDTLAEPRIIKKSSSRGALRKTVAMFNGNNSNRRLHNREYKNGYNRERQNYQTETVAVSNWNNSKRHGYNREYRHGYNRKYRNGYNCERRNSQTETVEALNGNNADRRSHNREYRHGYNRERQNSQTQMVVAFNGNNVDRHSHNREYRNDYNRERKNSQTQPDISIRSTSEGETAKKTIHMNLSLNSETKLDTAENAWVPAIAARNAQTVADGISVTAAVNIELNTTEEVNKKIRSILNKIAPENIDDMVRSFVELPINMFERLENATDMVFEKAIQEQNFASVYVKLCSVDMYVTVADNETISFKDLIIKKCKSLFESGKSHIMESSNKLQDIDLCRDPKKKKQLQCEHEDQERRSRKRSVANCCFVGELFKEGIIDSTLVENYIAYLVDQRSDESIECLCNLLRTSGNEIEQRCDLKDTFATLECFMSMKCMSSRVRFMVQDIVELKRKKWSTKYCP